MYSNISEGLPFQVIATQNINEILHTLFVYEGLTRSGVYFILKSHIYLE